MKKVVLIILVILFPFITIGQYKNIPDSDTTLYDKSFSDAGEEKDDDDSECIPEPVIRIAGDFYGEITTSIKSYLPVSLAKSIFKELLTNSRGDLIKDGINIIFINSTKVLSLEWKGNKWHENVFFINLYQLNKKIRVFGYY